MPRLTAGSPVHRPPALLDVVEEHLEEFGYLSIQRRTMTFSPEVGHCGVTRLDARLEAHRDGLLEAGPSGVEVAASHLEDADPWQCYAAARIWIELSEPHPEIVLDRLRGAAPDALPSWREALRRVPPETLNRVLPLDIITGAHEPMWSVLVDAWGRSGMMPADALDELSFADDPALRAAVARALSHERVGADAVSRGILDRLTIDPAREVRRAALWSLALLNRERTAGRCRGWLERDPDPFALQTLGLIGDTSDSERILPLVAPSETRDAAIRALGHLGDTTIVELLLRLLESGDVDAALAAGDAFETLVGPLPPAPRSRPPVRTDELAPRPLDAEQARRHWSSRRESLGAGRRWLRGKPFPDGAPAGETPMERQWRLVVGGWSGGAAWLRYEVPDGFFDAVPTSEALPGV